MSAQPKNRTTERAEAIHLWARHKQEVLLQESDRYTGLAKDAALKAVLRGDELGSPARCPRCRKPTAVWVPPGRWERSNIEHRTSNIEHRTSNIEHLTAGRRADLVAHMHRVVEHPELPADLLEYERQQYELGEAL